MKIVVLVKQVPQLNQIRFDHERKTVVREGVPLQLNPFDRRSISLAVTLRNTHGGEVVVITMGPPQARAALQECLAYGGDRAIHLVDRAFAGSDTLATARALALAIRREGPVDLIIAGRFSLDADTGQVGPEVAELLGIPVATSLRRLEAVEGGRKVIVDRETDQGLERIELTLPALVTCGEWMPRLTRPTPEQITAAEGAPILELTASDLSEDSSVFGLAGSPTYVESIRELKSPREQIVIADQAPAAAARALVDYLLSRGLFSSGARQEAAFTLPGRSSSQHHSGRDVWVVAEFVDGAVRDVTLELLGKGAQLAERLGGELWALSIGAEVAQHNSTLFAYGADRVLLAEDAVLGRYLAETYADVLAAAIQTHKPEVVLIPATLNGRELTPRVAARLGLGLTGDAIGLDIDEEGRLVQLKPAFGGNIIAPILSKTLPQMATVRPGMLNKARPDWSRQGEVKQLPVSVGSYPNKKILETIIESAQEGMALDTAEVIVCAGAGIGGPEGLPLIYDLARALDGAVAASLVTTNLGWLPEPQHIGATGKVVAPRFYIGVGVSGAFYHRIGIQKAATIAVINNDPNANFFKNADIGIVGDWHEVVPALIAELERARTEVKAKERAR